MPERVRVLIVDDSAFIRQAVERMLQASPEIEVVGAAGNGAEAVIMVKELHPDVVVLDVNMPRLDGLQALEQIMAEAPTGVLMLSTLTREGAQTTLRALELGAVDFLDKTSAGTVMEIYEIAPALREKVLAVAGASLHSRPAEPEVSPPEVPRVPLSAPVVCPYEVVVVGASTGGPRALTELLSMLPRDFPAGIVIAQHMPAGFTETLANRLDRRSELTVLEAHDGAPVEPGTALMAPGGKQIRLDRKAGGLIVRVEESTADHLHRPSVDLLFRSAAAIAGANAIGLILTGMGDDGADGLRAIRDAGGRTLTESEESAVIYGMPKAAAPASETILPIDQLADALVQVASDRRRFGASH
jgi:two-component system, chemotaxis family, protein-glutamate methylesterase/glutaminase